MKTHKNMTKKLGIWALVVAGILMIPLLTQAPWSAGDFIFAGIVLFILATIYEFTTRNMTSLKQKLLVGIILLGVIILIVGWAATGPD